MFGDDMSVVCYAEAEISEFPTVKLKYIHDQLADRAKKTGIAAVAVRNGVVFHTLNVWTDGLGKRDTLAICMYNGGPYGVVPFGGTEGLFGTNPISYAIPTGGKPIIADFATSEIPFFQLRNSHKDGIDLPAGVAVDNTGEVTTDPTKVYEADESGAETSRLLPMGGMNYKGYEMVLLVEIMTGALIRSKLSNEMNAAYTNADHGGIIIAIDIASLTDLNQYKQAVDRMCDEIRGQKPASYVDAITIPGDRSYQRLEEALQKGEMELDEELFNRLKALA